MPNLLRYHQHWKNAALQSPVPDAGSTGCILALLHVAAQKARVQSPD
jgi:hypothetical protein